MASQNERQFTELLGEISRQNLSLRGFAQKYEIDKTVLSRLINGRAKRIDPDLVRRISTATGGVIGMEQVTAFYERLTKPDRSPSVEAA